jgi:hypothetical protein
LRFISQLSCFFYIDNILFIRKIAIIEAVARRSGRIWRSLRIDSYDFPALKKTVLNSFL